VLVAEDNLINQKVVKNTLSKQGAVVVIANNGQEAIQQLKKGGFDIILMDIQMPEIDGYKATRYIRQVMRSDIPIIAMTADALKGEEDKCNAAGMNAYISKPFEPSALFFAIAELTGHTQPPSVVSAGLKPNDETIVDFSFLHEIADNDSEYIHEVLDIFISTMPDGLSELETLIRQTENYEAIASQAHFLKSSVGVVKVKNMYDQLAEIEALGREQTGIEQMRTLISGLTNIYQLAHPEILREREKHKPAQA